MQKEPHRCTRRMAARTRGNKRGEANQKENRKRREKKQQDEINSVTKASQKHHKSTSNLSVSLGPNDGGDQQP